MGKTLLLKVLLASDWLGRWVGRVSDVEAGRLTGYVRSTAAVV